VRSLNGLKLIGWYDSSQFSLLIWDTQQ
jgi:hypothetical protein